MGIGEFYMLGFVLTYIAMTSYLYCASESRWGFVTVLNASILWPLTVLVFACCVIWDLYSIGIENHEDED